MIPVSEYFIQRETAWYERVRSTYVELSQFVAVTIQKELSLLRIAVVSVETRVKEIAAFEEKTRRKHYDDPRTQMVDLIGFRILVFTESDADKICDIIARVFQVHQDFSFPELDKSEYAKFNGSSKVFVCDIGEPTSDVVRNEEWTGRTFEVQVRTVLQHAWIQLVQSPTSRFYAVPGTDQKQCLHAQLAIIEACDREINRIGQALDATSSGLIQSLERGDFDLDITPLSLRAYLLHISRSYQIEIREASPEESKRAVNNLATLGYHRLRSIILLFDQEFIQDYSKITTAYNEYEIVCLALLLNRFESYVDKVVNDYFYVPSEVANMLSDRYGIDRVTQKLDSCEVVVR